MAARPGYAQPDPRYPFANPPMPQQFPQQYQQRRRDYDAESDYSDPFGSRNTSTTHLTGNSPYYDHSEYLSQLFLCPRLLSARVPFLASIIFFLFHFVDLPPSPRFQFTFTENFPRIATYAWIVLTFYHRLG
jgi:hypothetical protein